MGEHTIREGTGVEALRAFTRALLEDLQALERMLADGRIQEGVARIGAEQELFLVGRDFAPVCASGAVLARLAHPQFTTELGSFNLEANLTPLELTGDCLTRMHAELDSLLGLARQAAAASDSRVALCGILPTLELAHLGLDAMTPIARYRELNETMLRLRGGEFRTQIDGEDSLLVTHDNVMLEACTTSFQVHLQVGGRDSARLYNLAQAATGPVLAAAGNSPLLFRHRLWHETRIALVQQAIDVRSDPLARRDAFERVSFGDRWVEDSVLEIFREDVARFRTLIAAVDEESPLSILASGGVPRLRALCLHNSTVYRWNRPCYGITGGEPHLRIENRVLPAGPTTADQVANAAFWLGLVTGLERELGDVRRVLAFEDVRANFLAAARYGLGARMRWLGRESLGADELVLRLLPLAQQGLTVRGVDAADAARYLGIVAERVESGRTGARWMLDSLARMGDRGRPDRRQRALVAAMLAREATGLPVHRWELAELEELDAEVESYRTVGQLMTTRLFTVGAEDLVDLAASLMDWKHIRHVPVEDEAGRLQGIVSHRDILRFLATNRDRTGPVPIKEIMKPNPVTVTPETGTLAALALIRRHGVGCLPVVSDGRLVGILTERDFIGISAALLDRWLAERDDPGRAPGPERAVS